MANDPSQPTTRAHALGFLTGFLQGAPRELKLVEVTEGDDGRPAAFVLEVKGHRLELVITPEEEAG